MFNTKKEPMGNPTQVHTTQNYSMFSPIDGNRNKNELHITRLKKSMQENYLFTTITVNEKFQIIDGQHRFEAIKSLNLPVNYVVCKGYGLKEVQILNANSKTWNADDYMEGYAKLGNPHYIKYKEFKNKYGFGHNECLPMLSDTTRGNGKLQQLFKRGEFRIVDLMRAEKNAKKILQIKNLYSGYNRRSFVAAMLFLFKKPEFNHVEFVNKLKLQPSALTDCSNTEQYLLLIEKIYNYHRKDKVSLRY